VEQGRAGPVIGLLLLLLRPLLFHLLSACYPHVLEAALPRRERIESRSAKADTISCLPRFMICSILWPTAL